MKLNINSVKRVQPNKNFVKKTIAVSISILVLLLSYIIINNSTKEIKNTVSVIRIKSSKGIPAQTVITKDDIEKYDIVEREYNEDMISADNIDNVIGTYAAHYLRKGTILYKDQIVAEVSKKNEWLYELDDDYEVLTLPYNYLECGGDILVPGDRIRIRATYETEEPNEDYMQFSDDPNQIDYKYKNSYLRTQVIFDSIVVEDLLNANSHSIYEVYKEVLKLPEDQRSKVMKSQEFIKSIQPKALVLSGTKEQINEYAKYTNIESKKLIITILSRKNSDAVIDQLPTLAKEVESWIEDKEKGE